MVLTSLKLQNFKKFKEATFEFFEGLTGILGKNGSGKSSIFEAIFFALYGSTKDKEMLRYSKASTKDVVMVELKFEIDGKGYLVKREFRGKALTAKATLYNSQDELISSGATEVTKSITSLIGLDKQAFKQTVFASQKELTSLSSLNHDERKKMIRELLGLEKIDMVEVKIKDRMLTLRREIEVISGMLLKDEELKSIKEEQNDKTKLLATQTAKLEKLTTQKLRLKKSIEEVSSQLEKIQKQKEERVALENRVKNISTRVEDKKASLKKLSTKQKELQELSDRFEKEKGTLQKYKEKNDKLQLLNDKKAKVEKRDGLEKEQNALRDRYISLKKEIRELQKFIEQKESTIKEVDSTNKTIEKLKKQQHSLEKEIEQLNRQINKYRGIVEDTEGKIKQIQKIGRESECPTCTRRLLDEYDSVVNSLNQKITILTKTQIEDANKELKPLVLKKETLLKEIDKSQQKLHKLDYLLKTIESQEGELRSKTQKFKSVEEDGKRNKGELEKLKKVVYDEKEHKLVLKDIKELEPKYKELLEIKGKIGESGKIEVEKKEAQEKLKEFEGELKSAKDDLNSCKYDEKKDSDKKEEYKKLKSELEQCNKEILTFSTKVATLGSEIKSLKGKIEQDTKQRAGMQSKRDQRADYEKLKEYLQSFKSRINSHIAPRISHYASSMFASITRGKYQHIEVDSEFNFYIYDEGVRYPIDRFSGGEIDLANLVLRIAISKSVGELSGGQNIGFLAFDEVFGSQDDERRFEIMDAFHKIKESYREIFLISHESEIKDMFERVIEL